MPPAVISITILDRETVEIDGRVVKASDLPQAVEDMADVAKPRVIVRASGDVVYGDVMRIMDALQRAGIYEVALIAR